MPHKSIVWKCEFCSDEFSDKEETIKHEKECIMNPVFKHCMSCGILYPASRGGCTDWEQYEKDKVYTLKHTGIANCPKHINCHE